MAAGWKKFTGSSQYPELTANKERSAFTYGSKQNRNYRMAWLQGRRNDVEEQNILNWVGRVTGVSIPQQREEAMETLFDGKILCRFLERLSGRSLIRPINDKPSLFSATDNVTNFLESCKRFGLTEDDLFSPNELLEKRDICGLVTTLKKIQEIQ